MPSSPIQRPAPLATLVATLLALAACGYTPPPRADTSSPAYQTAIDACQDTVSSAVNKQNAKTGLAWLASPVRRWSQIGDGVSACMAQKGYGRTRACTPAELRQGNRSSNMVVTASGIQCFDPGTRQTAP